MIVMQLPWPPSVNKMWRNVKGRAILSRAGREYRQFVESQAWEQDRRAWPLKGRLRVSVTAFPPDRRKRDLDNILKSLLDALGHIGAYGDDSQIDRLLVQRAELGGFVQVEIEEIA